MTARDDFDRTLSAWLTAQAPVREPEHLLEHVLERTARTRRRAAWRIPERWTLMTAISTNAIPRSPVPWRTVGLATLLALALVAGAIFALGSQYRRLPPPFGVAGNGSLLYSIDGDIVARAGPSTAVRPIVAGSDRDDSPIMASDGSKFVFLRHGTGEEVALWIANTDGTGQRALELPYPGISWVEWSPAGDEVFVANETGETTMGIVPADGSHPTTLDLGMEIQVPIHRPTHPDQILLRGKDTAGDWGLFLVGRDGKDARRLDLDQGFQNDDHYDQDRDYYFQGQTWSSDGSKLMYYSLEPAPSSPAGPGYRTHIATIGPSGDVIEDKIFEFESSADDEWGAGWLPAEDGIVFQSLEGTTHTLKLHRSSVSPTDLHDLGVTADDWISSVISPDGHQLIAMVPPAGGGDPSLELIDLQSFTATPLDVTGDVAWQRVAP
jgi:hypothetical protein